jgi:hypothetical protein
MTTQVKITDLGMYIQQEGQDEMNKVTGLVSGQYGTAIPLTIVDEDGQVVDLSSYTGITIKAISPDARTTLSFTGAFVVDGTDGEIDFTPTSSSTFDRDGTWKGQVQFSATDVLAPTVIFDIEVEKKI